MFQVIFQTALSTAMYSAVQLGAGFFAILHTSRGGWVVHESLRVCSCPFSSHPGIRPG